MNFIFRVSCFAEVLVGYMCCFKKWGFLSKKHNGVPGCDLSWCIFFCHHSLPEPFSSSCIKQPCLLVKSDWRTQSCPDCLSAIAISYFLILSDCTDLLNESLPCSYLTPRFSNLCREDDGSFFDEIFWKQTTKWIPVTMHLITNAGK